MRAPGFLRGRVEAERIRPAPGAVQEVGIDEGRLACSAVTHSCGVCWNCWRMSWTQSHTRRAPQDWVAVAIDKMASLAVPQTSFS